MAPKQGGRGGKKEKAKAQAAPPLHGCTIALSGTFSGHSQSTLEQDFVNALGASLAKTVNDSTTHLVTTGIDFAKPSAKVKQAQSHDVRIVKLAWLEDCLDQAMRLSEDAYSFDAVDHPPTVTANGKANGSRKRTVVATDDVGEDESQSQPRPKKRSKATKTDAEADASQPQPQPQPKKRGKATKTDVEDDKPQSQPRTKGKAASTNGANTQSQEPRKSVSAKGAKPEPKATAESKLKTEVADGQINIAKSSDVNIPLDENCPLTHYQVYIDNDGVIHDASLNQTNASNNNNKFYRLQLLRNANGDYKTWTRWGRVGERGQSASLGDGSLADAMHHFDSKFKSKSGLDWANRGANPKPNKYTFIERSYAEDSDNEEDATAQVKNEEKLEAPDSKLDPAIQELMELIFNQQYFAATMTDLNYDVNKLPLGKLSKYTITRGYQALKDLSALLDDASLAQTHYGTTFQAATEQLSNAFYSLIPHAFGRNRPPIIQDQPILKREIELLDSLSDMKEAASIMKNEPKDVERMNVLDKQFKGLNMDEMTPLKSNSTEFLELKNYLVDTRGSTHNTNYKVSQIFRIERQGEKDRFDKSPFSGPPRDRRLLWHGSRCTNFGGILSQGLRIAPPEAPVSGYMFGKGIYLADMSSKSANYCCPYISNGHALLLLCEAELGDPMLTLTNASYTAGEDAKAKGMSSTWGQGTTGPSLWKDAECVHPSLKGIKMPDTTVKPDRTNVDNAYLLYNEYITYDVAQVRLRYLFQVRM